MGRSPLTMVSGDALATGAVCCGVGAAVCFVMTRFRPAAEPWVGGTLVLFGLGFILLGSGGDPRDSAFNFGRLPVILAGGAMIFGGLLAAAKAAEARGDLLADGPVQNVLAAFVVTSFAAVFLAVALEGEVVAGVVGGVVLLVAAGIWWRALRKLARELGGGTEETDGRD